MRRVITLADIDFAPIVASPKKFQPSRYATCECGAQMARRSQMCFRCRDAKHKTTWTAPCIQCGGVRTGRYRKCHTCRTALSKGLKPCRRCGASKNPGNPRSAYCSIECQRLCPVCKLRDRGDERDMCKQCKAERAYLRRDRRCHRCGAHKFQDGETKTNRWFCANCERLCTRCDRPRTTNSSHCAFHRWEGQLRRYKISGEEWVALFEAQGRRCACCGTNDAGRSKSCSKDPTWDNPWCTDHDHESGKVRGILCQRCNKLLGQLGDSLRSIRRRVAQFERYLAMPSLFTVTAQAA